MRLIVSQPLGTRVEGFAPLRSRRAAPHQAKFEFRVEGLWFRVSGFGLGVPGPGFWVSGFGIGSGVRERGSGLRV